MRNFIPKTIRANCVSYEPIALYDGMNSPWAGYPYKWKAHYVIQNPQIHADPNTQTPFEYNGLDIVVGDWVGVGDGLAVRVVEILNESFTYAGTELTSPSTNSITLIVEDLEIYNLLNDPSQSGVNFIDGQSWFFSLSAAGVPMLNFIPSFDISVNFNSNLIARFQNKNYKTTDIFVTQNNHNLLVGDIIYINDSGLYSTISADSTNKDNFSRIVGQVSSIGTYGADSFTYIPRGNVVDNISPILPGNIGDVIYLDPALPGKLTEIKPSRFSVPLYIKLDDKRGVYLTGGGGGSSSSPLGYNASVYKVDNLAARDDIPADQLQVGDQIYVADTGNGEWAMYMYAGIIGVTPTWYKFTDFDSANTDAKTITVDLFYTQNQPLNIYSVGDTARVVDVTVEVLQTFHPTATLTVGDDSDTSRLTDVDDVDLSVLGIYSLSPSYQYGGTGETLVKVYYNQGSSTQGQAKITITYV
jgi:hypothetical protein